MNAERYFANCQILLLIKTCRQKQTPLTAFSLFVIHVLFFLRNLATEIQ